MSRYEPARSFSEGEKLTLDKMNAIIASINDRRVKIRLGFTGMDYVQDGNYSTTEETDNILIEARSVVATTGTSGDVTVPFETKFLKSPVVLVTWGDTRGRQEAFTAPVVAPEQVTKENFVAWGGKASSGTNKVQVRLNYIAIGPV